MAAPTRLDEKYYGSADGNPSNDTDPLGGAIATGTELNPASPSNLWSTLSIGTSSKTVYSIHYRKQENSTSGELVNARFYCRTGAIKNTNAGTASIASNKAGEDCTVRVVGKIGGNWDFEDIDVLGTTISVGSKIWDANSVLRWVVLEGYPIGILGCSVAGETVGVIYGTSDDPVDGNGESIACYMCSAEITWALATSKNTTLSSANRLTAPTGIGSFEPATLWANEDTSIAVPSGVFEIDDEIGICGKLVIEANAPQPPRDFQVMTALLGDAQS